MNEHEKVNYVELPAKNLQATKDFFSQAFGLLHSQIKALMVDSLNQIYHL
jgi:predicted enzyme related to lactoylglutathione lyase